MNLTLLIIIAVAVIGVLILGAGIFLLAGQGNRVGNVSQRVSDFSGYETEFLDAAETTQDVRRQSVADDLDKALEGRGFNFVGTIKNRISRADLKLRVSEYIAIVIASIVLFGIVGYFLLNFLGLGLGLFIGAIAPRIYANVMASRRLNQFNNQLSDTLNLWVNALRSGFSVMQAMEAIANELPPPVSNEFERVLQETRIGIDMEESLDNVLRRVESEDFDLIVTAVKIQREVGGNLAEILDVISFTIRERVRIKGEIKTLTAQGRLSGIIITLLPIGLGIMLYNINRPYMAQMIQWGDPFLLPGILPCGWLMLGIGGIMIAAGGFAIMKIVDIEV